MSCSCPGAPAYSGLPHVTSPHWHRALYRHDWRRPATPKCQYPSSEVYCIYGTTTNIGKCFANLKCYTHRRINMQPYCCGSFPCYPADSYGILQDLFVAIQCQCATQSNSGRHSSITHCFRHSTCSHHCAGDTRSWSTSPRCRKAATDGCRD